jgi:hypothetical protein
VRASNVGAWCGQFRQCVSHDAFDVRLSLITSAAHLPCRSLARADVEQCSGCLPELLELALRGQETVSTKIVLPKTFGPVTNGVAMFARASARASRPHHTRIQREGDRPAAPALDGDDRARVAGYPRHSRRAAFAQ